MSKREETTTTNNNHQLSSLHTFFPSFNFPHEEMVLNEQDKEAVLEATEWAESTGLAAHQEDAVPLQIAQSGIPKKIVSTIF